MINIKPIKFIHISDLHLNLKCENTKEDVLEKKRKLSMDIFNHIIEKCFIEDIKILLISGDLLDNNDYSPQLYNHINNQFESIPETQIYITPGNHDSVEKMYIYEYELLPQNVHIFNNNQLTTVAFDDKINIIGASDEYILNKDDLIQHTDHNKFNILTLHSPLGINVDNSYVTKEEAIMEGTNLNYCAFGHIHKFSGFSSIDNCILAHAGSPYKIEESITKHGYIVGSIENGVLDVHFEIINI